MRHCAMSPGRIVAGSGIEPESQGYEPCEMPLLYPAIKIKPFRASFYSTLNYPKSKLKKTKNNIFAGTDFLKLKKS